MLLFVCLFCVYGVIYFEWDVSFEFSVFCVSCCVIVGHTVCCTFGLLIWMELSRSLFSYYWFVSDIVGNSYALLRFLYIVVGLMWVCCGNRCV